MVEVRIFGVLVGVLFGGYLIVSRKTRSRLGQVISWFLVLSIILLSIAPSLATFLMDLYNLENRLFAVLVTSTLLLFAISLIFSNKLGDTRQELANVVQMMALSEYRRAASPLAATPPFVMVVIPAYKEEKTISQVLRSIPSELAGYRLIPLVVIDGNYDHTEKIVRDLGYRYVTHMTNQGQGSALRMGFSIARDEGAAIIVTMDADGQHCSEDLTKLLRPIIDNEADYVMGTRFAGYYADRGGIRHIGIVLFSVLITWLTNTRITDSTNGFRAIRAEKLALMNLRENRFNAPELIIQSVRHGLRIREVPVNILSRQAGESRKPRRLGYPLGFGMAMLRAWLRG